MAKNDIEFSKVKGYPTIYLFTEDEQIEYKGNRDKKSFIDFVNKNSKMAREYNKKKALKAEL